MQGTSRYLNIRSINYDFIPSRIESPKTLWVELKFYPPADLQVGNIIKLSINSSKLNHLDVQSLSNSSFYVTDIVGKRIVLKPTRGSPWHPSKISGCRAFGSGYDLTKGYREANYGSGESLSFLEYESKSLRSQPVRIPYSKYYPYYH